jgi:hypothetical protein
MRLPKEPIDAPPQGINRGRMPPTTRLILHFLITSPPAAVHFYPLTLFFLTDNIQSDKKDISDFFQNNWITTCFHACQ